VVGIAALFLLISYQNLYFGLDQLQGGNNGYWSLLIPGKFTNQPRDNGSPGAASAASPASTTGTAAPTGTTAKGAAAAAASLLPGLGLTPAPASTTSRGAQSGGLGVPGVIGR
jgi:hypothetical protein